ncbi:hypothetical protein ACFL24_01280 [Patescibacteria group bacterium]
MNNDIPNICPKCGDPVEKVDPRFSLVKCTNVWCDWETGEGFTFGISPDYLREAKEAAEKYGRGEM